MWELVLWKRVFLLIVFDAVVLAISFAIYSGILENLVEFRPECSHDLASQGLLKWLLQRIKQKTPFDGNKLYASEVLAILLQENDNTRSLLGEIDGIDILLQQLNVSGLLLM